MEFMTKHWLSLDSRNANLWSHEWNKHGTCISTLEPQCYNKDKSMPHSPQEPADGDVLDYFTHAALLYSTLPTFDFFARHGIVPSYEDTYELDHLRQAIRDSQHGHEATIRCRNHNELSEIWYSFNVRADLRHALDLWWDGNKQWNSWVPADPQGIRYLPKDGQKPVPSPTATATMTSHAHTATATATETVGPTARPFTGKGRLMVKIISDPSTTDAKTIISTDSTEHDQDALISAPVPSQYTGCLIRNGRWYASRSLTSCATFTAHDDVRAALAMNDDDDTNYHLFTLASRLAPCSFVRSSETSKNRDASADVQRQAQNQAGLHNRASLISDSEFQQPLSPLSFVDGQLLQPMSFSCDAQLPFQSILSNNATIDNQHSEMAKRLTLGERHQSVFWAEGMPRGHEQVRLWTDGGEDGDETEKGEMRDGRRVKVEVYWEAI
ncbi:Ribonuclease T2 precursor (RNase T2) [Exophiala xenobiotica]|uniref:ribonuclease T2 n=1 Tax=Lithohypha guttulata TaxID=1690604 RepID=A0ABR0KKS2_9EURO|nr:Ribonuclease T2 precursor (RNase T2) [Lithohypha guttulata]KAK5325420.1 Ribonuclease T2 precursor (RNase T2) [Exophiala xenobiotica]